MGDIVNLRMFRKRGAKSSGEATAAQNRATFGLSKQQKAANKKTADLSSKHLDQHRITQNPDESA